MREHVRYDVVVIGGGPAGLAGAVALARCRRSVLVVDAAGPAHHRAGAAPLAAAHADVTDHGGSVTAGTVVAVDRDDDGFRVTLDDGRAVWARRLLAATGAVDVLPDVPGLADRWGRDVLHCPHAQGWQVRDRCVGVLDDGPAGVRQALLWRQSSARVLLLRNGGGPLDAVRAEQLAARAVTVVDATVTGVTVDDDRLTGVRLADGDHVACDVLAVAPRPVARLGALTGVGVTGVDLDRDGRPAGTVVPADACGATAVAGVWVAGAVTAGVVPVAVAVAQGTTAAAAINADLVAEDTSRAVEAYRHDRATLFEADAWEQRYQARPAVWSGDPNPQLVAEVTDLTPGRALDVGCGEGADAVWLARRGWQVTAVDIAPTAVARTAERAARAGVADRVTARRADVCVDAVDVAAYQLVSAQFVHLSGGQWAALVTRLGEAVAPGGVLLLVGHHPKDLRTTVARMHMPDMMFTAEQAAALLDPAGWRVRVAETRPRPAVDRDGRPATVHDAVLVAERLPAPAGGSTADVDG